MNLNWQREGWDISTSIREIALAYIKEVQKVRKTGPYYLAGLSIGGQIAFEMGLVLSEWQNEVVIIMLDTYSGKYIRDNEIKEMTKSTFSNLKEVPLGQIPTLIHQKIRTFYKKFILPELNRRSRLITILSKKMGKPKSEEENISALLKSIRKNHLPAYLPGMVCYFRALQSRYKINLSYVFWKSLSKEFILYETECRHSNFVKPERAMDYSWQNRCCSGKV